MSRGPTHYQTLGVRPDASTADIRRAYLALARSLHPDRLGDRPAVEQERAQRRLQDVNQAWSVLRDEGRRREYDRSQRALADPAPRPAPRAAGATSPRSVPRPAGDDDEDLVAVAPPAGCAGGLVLGGFVALLALIAVFAAYASSGDGEDGPATTGGSDPPAPAAVRPEDIDPGDCVRAVTVGLEVVDCAGPHDAVVAAVRRLPAPCPEGDITADVSGTSIRLCLELVDAAGD